MMKNRKQSYGFSMVELLVAMVVGLVIISGAFSMHANTRRTQQVSEAQMDMVADARFAIEMISYDLRHAGVWGGTNRSGLIDCRYKGGAGASCTATSASDVAPVPVGTDCSQGWFYNLDVAVSASQGAAINPFSTACIPATEKYLANTDILQIHYAEAVPPAALVAGQAYVRSNFGNGRIFVGTQPPVLDAFETSPLTANHELHAYAYYISAFTDAEGDNLPSLRRVALVNGPSLKNQTLLAGVADLQVQLGEDLDGDGIVDSYVDPDGVTDPTAVYAAKIWLLMRSDDTQKTSKVKSFTLAGNTANYGADGYRYFMVSSVVNLRNLRQF